jgi:FAD synthetase
MIQDHSEHVDPPLHSLHAVCLELRERIESFLSEEPETPLLRNVQAQLRVSMRVVEEALEKYRCVFLLLCLPSTLSTKQVADVFAHRPEEISISYNGGKDCTS